MYKLDYKVFARVVKKLGEPEAVALEVQAYRANTSADRVQTLAEFETSLVRWLHPVDELPVIPTPETVLQQRDRLRAERPIDGW